MVRETEDDICFTRVMEIAKRIEHIIGQQRETTSYKRPHHFGGFSGASFRGGGRFVRGQYSTPFYHSPPPSQRVSVQSLFSALSA